MSNKFADITSITIQSGNGGNGAVSFRREKFVPKGGPDGGDGGDGGSVIFEAFPSERTLSNLRYASVYSAEHGNNGSKKNRHGKNGADIIIKVPLGTVVKDSNGGILCTIDLPTDKITVLKGGRGGKGNAFFKSSTRQTPRFAQQGAEGARLDIVVELELIADIGFVGAPNVGKSTLLKSLTKANPKIGNYPFTTLVPNLGTLKNAYSEVVLADIPGLIEGASDGHGLGLEFLKHIKKTRALAFVIDASYGIDTSYDSEQNSENHAESNSNENISEQQIISSIVESTYYQCEMLCNELALYDTSLLEKKIFIALSKIDMSLLSDNQEALNNLVQHLNEKLSINKLFPNTNETIAILPVSSYTNVGLESMKELLFEYCRTE